MPKPTAKLLWTKTNPGARTEPSPSEKEAGYVMDQRPSPFNFNWLLYIVDAWIDWLEEVTDAFSAYQSIYAAFVGTVGPGSLATHADLNAVMADGAIAAGARILVLDSATINTVQQITKHRVQIEFQPGAIYTKGSVARAIQVTADYVRIMGGQFDAFSTAEAILIDAGSQFTKISGSHFKNSNDDVTDNGTDTSITGVTTEV